MIEYYERETFYFKGGSPDFIGQQLYQAAMAFLKAAKRKHGFKRASVVVTVHLEG